MTTSHTETNEGKAENRWGMLLAWVFVAALLLLVGFQLAKARQGKPISGTAAPEFILTTFAGEEYLLADLRGKVVLINFWASWCIPCEDEAPIFQGAWEFYRERGDVIFLGIDYADTDTKGLAFIERFGITYPNGPDLGTRISQAYLVRAVPETYIIDKNGNLAFVKIGVILSMDELFAEIDPLLVP